jgi:hypothetical protein
MISHVPPSTVAHLRQGLLNEIGFERAKFFSFDVNKGVYVSSSRDVEEFVPAHLARVCHENCRLYCHKLLS